MKKLTVLFAMMISLVLAPAAIPSQVPPGGGFPNFCLGHSGQIVYIYIGNTLVAYRCA